MGAKEVAGAVRGRALARRRLGPALARRLAGHAGLDPALADLATGPYGRYARPGQDLATAERAIARTLLWHLRVLAGWQSPAATEPVRLLGAAFELANLGDHVRRITGGPAVEPYELGAFASAWRRLGAAATTAEVRAVLAASGWADPGADTPWALTVLPRLGWLRRVADRVPDARPWAAGAALLLLAREHLVRGRPVGDAAAEQLRPLVGAGCLGAATVPRLRAAAARPAGWVLDGIDEPDALWRAEVAWWRRVDSDGGRLLHGSGFGRPVAVGCAAVLAADAWRVRAALESAAHGHGTETFDALA
ncbi:hypothetical protein [Spirilliplanes yamanashiensis]|uniref:Uncharacterized protein n=1 Tax=Spirilliplanes yamanashiensis TaxID=42233 RepID=A0A8J4DLR8_9ACTN|nr:hypothetical protein [Spirilliplanes yamanashiensis]MDP9818269.1 hypothetical protein [Spirilliplanes yamanashiensis]GIJ06687.1 hypothetical protein Sya03_60390 [Spirilliplanes yamanashiensis]